MTFSVDQLLQRLFVLLVSTLLGLIISWIAWKKGYYHIPPKHEEVRLITWHHVLGVFGVFLATELIVVPSLYWIWLSLKQGSVIIPGSHIHTDSVTQGWINMLAVLCAVITLGSFYFYQNKARRRAIWGGLQYGQSRWRNLYNFFMGAITWLIAYPWIIVLTQIIGIILQFSYKGPHIDQIAVRHLKEAANHPFLLWVTIFAVVAIVPILEELLFRGFLQTWLKGLFGKTRAIAITSVVFAMFHFSPIQGIENFELMGALFILSCYLGFIRERQHSLWASIGLHSTFNFLSIALLLTNQD